MKRNYVPFTAGMATMMLLIGLVTAGLAGEPETKTATGTLDGQVAYGEVGVALFSKEYVAAGETRTTSKGAAVPTVLTYTDENGDQRYYVDAETICEVLDVAYGAIYNQELNCVDFGTMCLTDENGQVLLDQNGEPLIYTAQDDLGITLTTINGETIGRLGGDTSVVVGDISITSMDTDSPEYLKYLESLPEDIRKEEEQRLQERIDRLMETPVTPEYGTVRGMFTEVDPAEVDLSTYSGSFLDRVSIQDDEAVSKTVAFSPLLGDYAQLEIENQGDKDILVKVWRPFTVGTESSEENFSTVRVPAGETLKRAFRLEEEGNALENRLTVSAEAVGGGTVNIALSARQYRSGTADTGK